MVFDFHPKQQKFISDQADRKAFIGGRQSGKTTAALRLAAEHAASGEMVTYVSKLQRNVQDTYNTNAWKAAADGLGTFKIAGKHTIGSVAGGEIQFTSETGVRGRHPDVLVVDGICYIDRNIIMPLFPLCSTIYVVGSPRTHTMDIMAWLDVNDFSVTISTSLDNPSINKSLLDAWMGDSSSPEHILNKGPLINGHIFEHSSDQWITTISCTLCDMEFSIDTERDEYLPAIEAYAYGEARDQECQSKVLSSSG